ncbi:MAG: SusC/RagA family TonB-linked outer membrane protein, partial [Bacteroidota bacterium]
MTLDRAWSQQANVNLSGGTEFVRYFGSLTYSNEADIFNTLDLGQGYDPDFSYQRFNFRSNLDFQVTPTTTLSVNMSGWHGVKQIPRQGQDGGNDSVWKGLYEQPSDLYPIQYSNGFFGQDAVADRYPNPYVALNLDGIQKNSRTQVFSD